MGFGHGRSACPGRFFASNVLKITLCHLLLNYDFRSIGPKARVMTYGPLLISDPSVNVEIKRRKPGFTTEDGSV
jgi:cytochrome P450